MWLTGLSSAKKGEKLPEEGSVVESGEKALSANGASFEKGIPVYAPYGFVSVPPKSTDVLLIPCKNGTVCAGVKVDGSELKDGEVMIFSMSGAKIKLCRNGSVQVNGVTITSDGTVYAKDFIKE